jgi:hypothetical protein
MATAIGVVLVRHRVARTGKWEYHRRQVDEVHQHRYDAILDACWNNLMRMPARIASTTTCSWEQVKV